MSSCLNWNMFDVKNWAVWLENLMKQLEKITWTQNCHVSSTENKGMYCILIQKLYATESHWMKPYFSVVCLYFMKIYGVLVTNHHTIWENVFFKNILSVESIEITLCFGSIFLTQLSTISRYDRRTVLLSLIWQKITANRIWFASFVFVLCPFSQWKPKLP